MAIEMAAHRSLILLLVHLRLAGSESEQMRAASFEKLAPKEWRLASTGWGCHIFNDGTGLIIFLGPGEGDTGEGVLRMQEREGGRWRDQPRQEDPLC